jgi:isoaspartyl peptidase/L-asparaginase-like protein (Ntn-hydrolase superfamily)
LWNFEDASYKEIFCDTIKAVAIDKEGVFAVANSTGGFLPMMLAKTVYDMISRGEDIKKACKKGISMFPPEIKIGIIAMSKEGFTVASNTEMANYVLIKEI